MSAPKKWLDIADALTDKGFAAIKIGQALRFNKDGKINDYVVMRKDKKRRKVWVRVAHLFVPDPEQEALMEAQIIADEFERARKGKR